MTEETQQHLIWFVTGGFVLIIFLGVCLQGCEIRAHTLEQCVHDTQKPLECRAMTHD